MGDLLPQSPLETTPSHLSAALDFSWMDFPKPSRFTTIRREYASHYSQGILCTTELKKTFVCISLFTISLASY